MSRESAILLAEALHLPEAERGELAAKLIDSLDPDRDEDVEAAWSVEIQRRLDDLRTGRVRPVPWDEARRRILEDGDESAPA
jgi:putative addiction module component (TIGR02574 family)